MKRALFAGLLLCMIGGVLILDRRGQGQSTALPRLAAGEVAAQLVGRLLISADGTGQMFGYFPSLQGLPGPFFSGSESESTAYFTFSSVSFQVQTVANGSILHLFSSPIGGVGSVTAYFNSYPNQDFSNPASFSAGQAIAVFGLEHGMATAIPGGASLEIGSLTLNSSTPFSFQGQNYNLNMLGNGITLTAFFPAVPAASALASLPVSIPFGATATATSSPEAVVIRR